MNMFYSISSAKIPATIIINESLNEIRKKSYFCRFKFVPAAFRGIFSPTRIVRQKPTYYGKHQRSKAVKVVDSLNPYIASANVRLVLDLVASRSGVGLALRCLSFLEMDVQNNWKPFKPVMQFIR